MYTVICSTQHLEFVRIFHSFIDAYIMYSVERNRDGWDAIELKINASNKVLSWPVEQSAKIWPIDGNSEE